MSGNYKRPAYSKVEADNRFVKAADGSMVGDLDMGSNDITNASVICSTEIHSICSYTHYQDILVSELSGFAVTGNVSITGNVIMTGTMSANNMEFTGASIGGAGTYYGTGYYLTLTINGSSLYLPLYRI